MDKGEVTVGTQVLQEAQGKGGMLQLCDITYRIITILLDIGTGGLTTRGRQRRTVPEICCREYIFFL